MLYGFLKGKLYVPLKSTSYSLFLLFIIVLCICTFFNALNISEYYFKQTTGFQRFFRQFLSVVIAGVIFFLVFVNVCRDYGVKEFFIKIRKIFLWSFIVVFSCGILEYLISTYGYTSLTPLFELYSYLPFVEVELSSLNRVESITYEPPALGTYLITISPFMFSYIISSNKRYGFLPFLFVFILALMSKSRTVLVVIFVQIIIAVYIYYKAFPIFRRVFSRFMIVFFTLGVVLLLVFWTPIIEATQERIKSLDITKTEYSSKDNSVSNKSRLGIQYAMLQVYKRYPVFGIGWGQQTFESKNYYPKWATDRNWEFPTKYLNEDIKSFPPGYNMYLRVLTETGIIGLVVFLVFLLSIMHKSYQVYNSNKDLRYISISLIICFYGMFLNWLQIDSFGIYGFWLCLAMLIILNKNLNEKSSSTNTTL